MSKFVSLLAVLGLMVFGSFALQTTNPAVADEMAEEEDTDVAAPAPDGEEAEEAEADEAEIEEAEPE